MRRGLFSSVASRSLIAVAAALAAQAITPAAAAGQDTQPACPRTVAPGEPVVLCGETTVSGQRTARIRVRLPEPVSIRRGVGRGVGVDGGGRFAGIVLAQDGPTGARLIAGRVVPDKIAGFTAFHVLNVESVQTPLPGGGFEVAYVFPAGDYWLHLVADDTPVAVTLHLRGLTGSVALNPTGTVDHQLRDLTERVSTPALNLVHAAGDAAELTTDGLIFDAVWLRAATHAESQIGSCLYDGDPPQPPGYAPYCPGSFLQGHSADAVIAEDYTTRLEGVTFGLPAGRYGVGAWHQTVSQIEDWGAIGLWLSLGDPQ